MKKEIYKVGNPDFALCQEVLELGRQFSNFLALTVELKPPKPYTPSLRGI